MKPALIIMDIQKRYFHFDEKIARCLNQSLEYINAAIDIFRAKNLPIICVQNIDEKNNFTPKSEDFVSPEALKVCASDIHIHKTYCNAFNKTELATVLQKMNVDTVIITGFAAEYCVLSTYKASLDYDLTPIMLRGALIAMKEENIKFIEQICETISLGTLYKFVDNV